MKKIILLISLFLTTQIIKAQCWNTIYDGGTSGYNFFKIKTDGTLWTALASFLGGKGIAGGKMKSTGTTQWFTPNKNATDSSGFSAIPVGYCLNNGGFERIGSNVHWWTTTETTSADAWSREVNYNGENIYRNYTIKTYGFSVRLLKDY